MLGRDPERQCLGAVCRGCRPHHLVCYSTRRFIEILLIYFNRYPISPYSVICVYMFWRMGYAVGGGTCAVGYPVSVHAEGVRYQQKCIFLE